MTHSSQFSRGVRVRPCSLHDLRTIAQKIRRALSLENIAWFPVIRFLELLQRTVDGFDFEIVPKGELPKGTFAYFDPITWIVRIGEPYYGMANKGDGFARWTILHECLHFFLHRNQLMALARQDNRPHKIYEDSEWQADTLAREILMPIDLITPGMTVEEVAATFGVSKKAAKYRLDKLEK